VTAEWLGYEFRLEMIGALRHRIVSLKNPALNTARLTLRRSPGLIGDYSNLEGGYGDASPYLHYQRQGNDTARTYRELNLPRRARQIAGAWREPNRRAKHRLAALNRSVGTF
jgi:hypothetical protein